ncbi:hypothetical protein [Pseudomonas aeruginosa]|uniref:hypothetical protein n=1 Tax=Pseudomonas aeruginosa TaxID=287 RepID=UPI0021AE1020|nr:hypothetical protein [Pseudomonas aeruginosa]
MSDHDPVFPSNSNTGLTGPWLEAKKRFEAKSEERAARLKADLQLRDAVKREIQWKDYVQEQREREYDRNLIVSTCHEVMRDCPDPEVRLQAAMLLERLRPWNELNVVKSPPPAPSPKD